MVESDTAPESSPRTRGEPDVARAGALIQAMQYAEAIKLLHRALHRAPTDPELHYLLGVAAFRSNDQDTALSAFKRSICPVSAKLAPVSLKLAQNGHLSH
jgi:Flp pilus assembly protein TadD